MEDILTYDTLRKALTNFYINNGGKSQEAEESAVKEAEILLGFFGYDGYLPDNRLNPKYEEFIPHKIRAWFYMLEEEGILTTDEIETTIKKEQTFIVHYWCFNYTKIKELSKLETEEKSKAEDSGTVYSNLSEDIWSRKKGITQT